MSTPLITVIIPTMASRERAATLSRALGSIREQDTPAYIIAVVNGNRRDPDVMDELQRAPDVRTLTLEEGNLVKALTAGVGAVETPYFCILDDDDVLLPGACGARVEYMETHPQADVLVTRGYKQYTDGRKEEVPQVNTDDPLASLLVSNWLAACGGVYRTKRIDAAFFASMPRYLEWTYLAFRLARERTVHFGFDGKPQFIVFETAGSESRNLHYVLAMPANISRMRDPLLPSHVQRLLARRLARAFHDASTHCMDSGHIREAWRFHLKCLWQTGGIRYLLFTRQLILATFRTTRIAELP